MSIGRDLRPRTQSYVIRMLGSIYPVPAAKSRADGTLPSQLPPAGSDILLLPASLPLTAHASS